MNRFKQTDFHAQSYFNEDGNPPHGFIQLANIKVFCGDVLGNNSYCMKQMCAEH